MNANQNMELCFRFCLYKLSRKAITMSIILTIITAFVQISLSGGAMVGCYHCEVEVPGCALHDEGILASLQDCKDKCTDATCYGLQYYISTGQCYNFQETTGCKMLQYNGAETILIYRQSGRTDCSLFSLTMTTGKVLIAAATDEIDPSTRGNCVHEGLVGDGYSHAGYKESWSDCYLYSACSSCSTYSTSGFDLYEFECIVDCGSLTAPANGAVNYNGTTEDATAIYSCDPGFQIVGTGTQTCKSTGMWTGAPPTCETIDCGPLTNPDNGTVRTLSGTTSGNDAVYDCDLGYGLQGSGTRTCGSDGAWSGNAPSCEPVDCGALADPVHGTVTTPEGTTYGAKALYLCDGRYKLSGPQARTCLSTGNWWGTETSCEPIECDTLIVNSAELSMTLTNETYLDSVAMFTCSAGYSLVGMAEIPCIWNNDTGDPEWNGSIPSCQPIATSASTTTSNTPTPTSQSSTSSNTPSQSSTSSNTPSQSSTSSNTPSQSSTASNTPSQSSTASNTLSQSSTASNTPSQSSTASNTPSQPSTASNTPSQSSTASNTPSQSSTASNTPSQSSTALNTPSQSSTTSNTPSQSSTASNTPGQSSTASNTPSQSSTASNTPSQSSSSPNTTNAASNPLATTPNPPATTTNPPATTPNQLATTPNQPGSTPNPPATTSSQPGTTTVSVSKPIYLWPCLCSTNAFAGLSQEEIIEQLVSDMRIDTDQTANALSKRISREDNRPSAVRIGTIGIVLLAIVGGLFLILDLMNVCQCRQCSNKNAYEK